MGRVKADAQASGLGSQVDSSPFTEVMHIHGRAGLKEWWWNLVTWIRDAGETSKWTMFRWTDTNN